MGPPRESSWARCAGPSHLSAPSPGQRAVTGLGIWERRRVSARRGGLGEVLPPTAGGRRGRAAPGRAGAEHQAGHHAAAAARGSPPPPCGENPNCGCLRRRFRISQPFGSRHLRGPLGSAWWHGGTSRNRGAPQPLSQTEEFWSHAIKIPRIPGRGGSGSEVHKGRDLKAASILPLHPRTSSWQGLHGALRSSLWLWAGRALPLGSVAEVPER